ncbi:MAG: hypothetical protein RSD88_07800 [Anaerovoracaceae bacterium]
MHQSLLCSCLLIMTGGVLTICILLCRKMRVETANLFFEQGRSRRILKAREAVFAMDDVKLKALVKKWDAGEAFDSEDNLIIVLEYYESLGKQIKYGHLSDTLLDEDQNKELFKLFGTMRKRPLWRNYLKKNTHGQKEPKEYTEEDVTVVPKVINLGILDEAQRWEKECAQAKSKAEAEGKSLKMDEPVY